MLLGLRRKNNRSFEKFFSIFTMAIVNAVHGGGFDSQLAV